MLKRALRILLLVELLVVAALCYAAVHLWHWHPALALAGALAVLLALRLYITVQNFCLGCLYRSATPPAYALSPWQRCKLLAGEYAAMMLASSYSMVWPAAALLRAPDPAALRRLGGVPVLLVHGYASNRGFWNRLSRLLERAGIGHAALDLEPLGASIDAFVPLLARAVEALCAAAGSAQVTLVAHSMGGLVVRAYLRQHGSARVAGVVTLGSPHHGTGLANLAFGPSAGQMRRSGRAADATGSAWLQALAGAEGAQERALITSIYSHHDNLIAPQTSSELPGAKNIAFGGIGHVALARHPAVLRCVLDEIARIAAAPAAATPEWSPAAGAPSAPGAAAAATTAAGAR